MSLVELSLPLSTPDTLLLSLLVRRTCELVLHLATERSVLPFAFGTRRELAMAIVVIVFVVSVSCNDVVLCWRVASAHALLLDSLALFARKRRQILFVVIWVDPNRARWFFRCVYKVLMVVLRVELADPTLGQGSALVFHTSSMLCRNASITAAPRHREMRCRT